jgi:hypothetical protein
MIFRYLLQFAHHANGNVVIISKSQPSLIIYIYYIILYYIYLYSQMSQPSLIIIFNVLNSIEKSYSS